MPAAFDTIAAVRRLEDAGLPREAAEAITAGNLEAVHAAREAAFADRDALATRADLAPLATKAELSALEARMTWRIIGLVIAANPLLVAAVKLIP